MILPCLFTEKTSQKGWGVFTNEPIKKNTIIEISPVIIMSEKEKLLLDQTKLHDYIFFWEDDKCCMAMGNIPIYNHAVPSNCEYFQDYDNEIIFIKTVRKINAGEELTINYQGDFQNQTPVWFEMKD